MSKIPNFRELELSRSLSIVKSDTLLILFDLLLNSKEKRQGLNSNVRGNSFLILSKASLIFLIEVLSSP